MNPAQKNLHRLKHLPTALSTPSSQGIWAISSVSSRLTSATRLSSWFDNPDVPVPFHVQLGDDFLQSLQDIITALNEALCLRHLGPFAVMTNT